jgi:hypothetical protein
VKLLRPKNSFALVVILCVAISLGLARFSGTEKLANAEEKSCSGTMHLPLSQQVGKNFKVKVWSPRIQSFAIAEGPLLITSLPIALVQGGYDNETERIISISKMDSEGIGTFRDIPPGKYGVRLGKEYSIRIDELASVGTIHVIPNEAKESEIALYWPGNTYTAKQFRGSLMLRHGSREASLVDLYLVQLLDWNTGKVVARTYTNRDGRYEIHTPSRGIYRVRFSETPDPESRSYEMVAEIRPDAYQEDIPALKTDFCSGLVIAN